jgi:hypothetical protein
MSLDIKKNQSDSGKRLKIANLQDLSSRLGLGLGNLLQHVVVGEGRVCGPEARVGSAVNALVRAVLDELGRGVVGVELDLVDGGNSLARVVLEKHLEVLDGKVGHTNVLDAARGGEFLQLSPRINKAPIGKVLLEIIGVGGRRPVHKIQVNIVCLQVLERRGYALFNTLVPGIVQLGGDPNVLARHTRVLDAETDLSLVAVGQSSVNVAVASEESGLDGFANLIGL